MRLLALVLLASSLLALPASGAGGLVVVGVGEGDFVPARFGCERWVGDVVAIFAPGDQGSLSFQWAAPPGDGCFPMNNGGTAGIGTLHYDLNHIPPAAFAFACTGNEAQGMSCADGCLVLGPYPGPGGKATLTGCVGFTGTFTVA